MDKRGKAGSPKAAAEALGVSPDVVRYAIKEGRLTPDLAERVRAHTSSLALNEPAPQGEGSEDDNLTGDTSCRDDATEAAEAQTLAPALVEAEGAAEVEAVEGEGEGAAVEVVEGEGEGAAVEVVESGAVRGEGASVETQVQALMIFPTAEG